MIVDFLCSQITEEDLRNHFTPDVVREITDCKLKYDVNGNFRGFAFIGFKSVDIASQVIRNYNKSYITTSRIIVENYEENVTSAKDKISKTEVGDAKYIVKQRKSNDESLDPFEGLNSDPKFQVFLNVQRNIDVNLKKSMGNYIWSDDVRNDEVDVDLGVSATTTSESSKKTTDERKSRLEMKKERRKKKQTKKNAGTNNVESKAIVPIYQVKLMKLPCKVKKSQIKEFFSPITPSKVVSLGAVKGIAYANFKTESDLEKALLKHKSFLDGKQIDVKDVSGKLLKSTSCGQEEINCDVGSYTKKVFKEPTESVADTSRLYIRNLSYAVKSEDIEDLFKPFGELSEVYVPVDQATKIPKGFAFVSFLFPEHAIKALESLDKTVFQGRLLHIIPGASKPNTFKQFNQLSSFKQTKQAAEALNAEKPNNWNSLFLSANATAAVMAKRYDVSKSELLADANASDSIAVRMALGETQIVNETKAFLIDNGIDLDSFNDPIQNDQPNNSNARKKMKRSKTTILVKNLPPETTKEDIESLFSRYGSINRVLLPPFGITAIVEMQNVSEAKKAFEKMSVFKFKHVPLFLEWAPVNIFKSDSVPNVPDIKLSVNINEKPIVTDAATREDSSTLFVKNISFDTSDESFKSHFEKCGKLVSAKVSRRKGTGKDGQPIQLSMGFGFVEYQKKKDAEKGLRDLQNSLLDGHRLHVARSKSVGATSAPVVARSVVLISFLSFLSLHHEICSSSGWLSQFHLFQVQIRCTP